MTESPRGSSGNFNISLGDLRRERSPRPRALRVFMLQNRRRHTAVSLNIDNTVITKHCFFRHYHKGLRNISLSVDEFLNRTCFWIYPVLSAVLILSAVNPNLSLGTRKVGSRFQGPKDVHSKVSLMCMLYRDPQCHRIDGYRGSVNTVTVVLPLALKGSALRDRIRHGGYPYITECMVTWRFAYIAAFLSTFSCHF